MAKAVLSKEEADKVAVAFSPRKFPHSVSPTAKNFVAYQSQQADAGKTSSFQLDRIVAQQTGVAELERITIEEKVEQEALARLKEIEEQAYQQAYQIGLEEGREKAYVDQHAALAAKLDQFESLIATIENLKTHLVDANEAHFMRLVFYVARRLAMDEIKDRREIVLNVVRQSIENAQSDENVTVRVSQDDFSFIESIKERLGKEFDSVKKAKFEAGDTIADGGCVIETNYGDVDATVEERLDKLWNAISEKLPKTEDVFGDGSGDGRGGDGS